MKILHIENGKRRRGILVTALIGKAEFAQLRGQLEGLVVFPAQLVREKTSCTKTGARHSYAKYLLFPSKLRRKFPLREFDFEGLRVGTLRYREQLFVVYGVPLFAPRTKMQGQ